MKRAPVWKLYQFAMLVQKGSNESMLFESSKQTAAASAGAASFHRCLWENWNVLEFGTEIKSWIMRCQTVASPSSIRVGIHVLYLYTISSTCWLISKASGKGLLGRPKLKFGQEQTGSEVWSLFVPVVRLSCIIGVAFLCSWVWCGAVAPLFGRSTILCWDRRKSEA